MTQGLPDHSYGYIQHGDLNFPQWQVGSDESFGTLTIECPDPDSFIARVSTASLGEVELFDMQTPAHTVIRPEGRPATEHDAYCKLSLQLEGQVTMTQDGRTCTLSPGDLALYVAARPYQLDYLGPQRSLVVLFPQSYIRMSPEQLQAITATPLSDSRGLGKVAVTLFEQLARNLEELQGAHALALVKSALDMLITVMAAEFEEPSQDPKDLLFHQAVSYIADHLDDPNLSPGTVANALYISLRQLHGRFSAKGLTVAHYIRTRRLEAIREDLANPLYRGESVQSISARYALFDPSHVSKAFKAEYGEPPSAYRSRILSL